MTTTLTSSTTARPIIGLPAGMLTDVDRSILSRLNIVPIFGGAERGIHARGDILTQTQDGVDLNTLWNEFQATMSIFNERRDSLVRLLTYPVTTAYEDLYQGGAQAEFEDATEYGLPVGYRPSVKSARLGYDFGWKDLGGYFTWAFLADATAAQVQAFNNMAIEADNRTVFRKVMNTLFNNTRRTNKEGNIVVPFYNGQTVDSLDTPPPFGATTFAAGHNHFMTSGSATLDQQDVEAMQDTITEHGYSASRGNTLILLVNKAQADTMRNWRALANGGAGRYDFVPAAGTPAFLLGANPGSTVVGGQPSSNYQGFNVVGTYGEFTVVQEDYIPAGYLVGFATGGQDSLPNPIAFREHTNANLRGLRLVKGRTPDYPLIDSVYNHGFGTGVRHRGSVAVMQVTAGTYSIPTQYA